MVLLMLLLTWFALVVLVVVVQVQVVAIVDTSYSTRVALHLADRESSIGSVRLKHRDPDVPGDGAVGCMDVLANESRTNW